MGITLSLKSTVHVSKFLEDFIFQKGSKNASNRPDFSLSSLEQIKSIYKP